jgi:hypothetical protein
MERMLPIVWNALGIVVSMRGLLVLIDGWQNMIRIRKNIANNPQTASSTPLPCTRPVFVISPIKALPSGQPSRPLTAHLLAKMAYSKYLLDCPWG